MHTKVASHISNSYVVLEKKLIAYIYIATTSQSILLYINYINISDYHRFYLYKSCSIINDKSNLKSEPGPNIKHVASSS